MRVRDYDPPDDAPLFEHAERAAAEHARDLGISRSVQAAEDREAGWAESALAFLHAFAETHESFTAEQVTTVGPAVPTSNRKAWGAIFRAAARDRLIEQDGFGVSTERHLSPCVRWKSLVFSGPLTPLAPAH